LEAEELGAGWEEQPLFPPTPPPSWRLQERSRGGPRFPSSSLLSFICDVLGARIYSLLGQARVEGNGELVTCRHCADNGRETGTVHLAMI